MGKPLYEMRDFVDILTDIDDGKLNHQAGVLLRKVVQAVQQTNKQGELTIKIKVAQENRQIMLSTDLKYNPPAMSVRPALFFSSDDGNLTRNNPKQQEIPGLDPVRLVGADDE